MYRVLMSPPDTGELEIEYVTAAMRSGWVAPAGPDLAAFEEEVADRVGVPHAVGLSPAPPHYTSHCLVGSGSRRRRPRLHPHLRGDSERHPVRRRRAVLRRLRPRDRQHGPGAAARGAGVAACGGSAGAGRVPGRPARQVRRLRARSSRLAPSTARGCSATPPSPWAPRYSGRPAGSFGDASVLSFNGNKIMTTSGGGMLLTDDGDLADHVRKLSTQAREPVAHYEHTEVGYNYRLSNILAALGRAQLAPAGRHDRKRRRVWRERYRASFADVPGVQHPGRRRRPEDNCWLTAIVVDPAVGGLERRPGRGDGLDAPVSRRARSGSPCTCSRCTQGLPGTLDGSAEGLFEHGLTLPSGSAMTEDQFERRGRDRGGHRTMTTQTL